MAFDLKRISWPLFFRPDNIVLIGYLESRLEMFGCPGGTSEGALIRTGADLACKSGTLNKLDCQSSKLRGYVLMAQKMINSIRFVCPGDIQK